MDEGIVYLIIFCLFLYWIMKPKPSEINKQPGKPSARNIKEHIQYITAMEKYKIKTNKYPNMNNEDDVIEFVKCYNEAGRGTEPRAMGGYYNQPYPPQNHYIQHGQWR